MRDTVRMGSAVVRAGLLWIVVAALAGCGGSAPARPSPPETVSGLHVETLQQQSIPNNVEAPGTVIAVRSAQVAARVMGTVLEVTVHEGDRVRRGQLLVQLDDQESLARRNAARAGLEQARAAQEAAAQAVAAAQSQAEVAQKTYGRFVFLRKQKSVSPQEFDEVQAKQSGAQAALAEARANQQQASAAYAQAQQELRASDTVAGYARILAPFDGVVLHRYVDPGSMAAPGAPLLVVEDPSQYRLQADVDAEAASNVHRGTLVPVELDALPGKTFPGKVADLEPGANPMSHTVQVKIDLPRDPALRSGLFGRALFQNGKREAIVVPNSALLERGQLREVYAVDAKGIAHLRLVTLGAQAGQLREVLSGLGVGERIVTDPAGHELDGKRVEAGQ
ncbi:MAG TPA: efflux RND transporter periplasmic adaptor subunit [Candidatus Limnocylindrales bacterium]|nr:efflux RND transporter periplasmic adaptor subunit [Candidatus Limnocylindrales bacterium]